MGILAFCSCAYCFKGVAKLFKSDLHQTRILGYLLIFYIYQGIGALVFFTFSNKFMDIFKDFVDCPEEYQDACYGASMIFRLSASLFIFFLIITILMLPKDDFSYRVNQHCWIIKWLVPGILFFAFCFMPNIIFEIYGHIAKFMAVVFLII